MVVPHFYSSPESTKLPSRKFNSFNVFNCVPHRRSLYAMGIGAFFFMGCATKPVVKTYEQGYQAAQKDCEMLYGVFSENEETLKANIERLERELAAAEDIPKGNEEWLK